MHLLKIIRDQNIRIHLTVKASSSYSREETHPRIYPFYNESDGDSGFDSSGEQEIGGKSLEMEGRTAASGIKDAQKMSLKVVGVIFQKLLGAFPISVTDWAQMIFCDVTKQGLFYNSQRPRDP